MTRLKPITYVLPTAAEAQALQEEYTWIGRDTRRDGRFLTVLLTTIWPRGEK